MTVVRDAPGAQAAPPAGRARRWEPLAALAACALASLFLNHRLLRPQFLSDDALVHLYWLDQVRHPGLFTDALTADLRTSGRYPDGYEARARRAARRVRRALRRGGGDRAASIAAAARGRAAAPATRVPAPTLRLVRRVPQRYRHSLPLQWRVRLARALARG